MGESGARKINVSKHIALVSLSVTVIIILARSSFLGQEKAYFDLDFAGSQFTVRRPHSLAIVENVWKNDYIDFTN